MIPTFIRERFESVVKPCEEVTFHHGLDIKSDGPWVLMDNPLKNEQQEKISPKVAAIMDDFELHPKEKNTVKEVAKVAKSKPIQEWYIEGKKVSLFENEDGPEYSVFDPKTSSTTKGPVELEGASLENTLKKGHPILGEHNSINFISHWNIWKRTPEDELKKKYDFSSWAKALGRPEISMNVLEQCDISQMCDPSMHGEIRLFGHRTLCTRPLWQLVTKNEGITKIKQVFAKEFPCYEKALKYLSLTSLCEDISIEEHIVLEGKSQFDPDEKISLDKWAVTLVHSANRNRGLRSCSSWAGHAMILIEGIDELGQRFLYRPHLTKKNGVQLDINPKSSDIGGKTETWIRPKREVEELLKRVVFEIFAQQIGKPQTFLNLRGSQSFSAKYRLLEEFTAFQSLGVNDLYNDPHELRKEEGLKKGKHSKVPSWNEICVDAVFRNYGLNQEPAGNFAGFPNRWKNGPDKALRRFLSSVPFPEKIMLREFVKLADQPTISDYLLFRNSNAVYFLGKNQSMKVHYESGKEGKKAFRKIKLFVREDNCLTWDTRVLTWASIQLGKSAEGCVISLPRRYISKQSKRSNPSPGQERVVLPIRTNRGIQYVDFTPAIQREMGEKSWKIDRESGSRLAQLACKKEVTTFRLGNDFPALKKGDRDLAIHLKSNGESYSIDLKEAVIGACRKAEKVEARRERLRKIIDLGKFPVNHWIHYLRAEYLTKSFSVALFDSFLNTHKRARLFFLENRRWRRLSNSEGKEEELILQLRKHERQMTPLTLKSLYMKFMKESEKIEKISKLCFDSYLIHFFKRNRTQTLRLIEDEVDQKGKSIYKEEQEVSSDSDDGQPSCSSW